MTDAARFIAAARAMLGVRWRHRGRMPWAVDCAGLVVVAARTAGLDVQARLTPEYDFVYGREPWDDILRKGCQTRWGEPLATAQARPGDVALMRWRASEPCHVGIVAHHPDHGLTLIHAHNFKGVIEQGLRGEIAKAVLEVYRPWGEA